MSTTTTALRPVARTAPAENDDPTARLAVYRARVDILRRSYRRRACRNGFAANGLSLLLVAAGAAVGLLPLVGSDARFTAGLGVAIILLEGIARVMKPALHAARAKRVSRKLDREFRLYDALARRLPLRRRQGSRGVPRRGRADPGAGRRRRGARRVRRRQRADRPPQSQLSGRVSLLDDGESPSRHGESHSRRRRVGTFAVMRCGTRRRGLRAVHPSATLTERTFGRRRGGSPGPVRRDDRR